MPSLPRALDFIDIIILAISVDVMGLSCNVSAVNLLSLKKDRSEGNIVLSPGIFKKCALILSGSSKQAGNDFSSVESIKILF